MKTRMTVDEAILDAIVDDMESIEQVYTYLQHLGIQVERTLLKEKLINLLKCQLIRIVYPKDRSISDLESADVSELAYWFYELTETGYEMWKRIRV